MLPFLSIFHFAQAIPIPVPPPNIRPNSQIAPQIRIEPQEIRALPGRLDKVPVFNSNSPEVVYKDGILLSTFPTDRKQFPGAHLNYRFEGRFDIFAHHIARSSSPNDNRPLYLGIVLGNASRRTVTVDIMQAVSYVTNPDAPFVPLPNYVDDPSGSIYAGPGSRLTNDILRGRHQSNFPSQIVLEPGETQMLLDMPIAIGNARSTLIRLRSSGPVYAASLAMYALRDEDNKQDRPRRPVYRSPDLEEWEDLLDRGNLVFPRDRAPTPPNSNRGNTIYGRVAGVTEGSLWQTQVVDPGKRDLRIPPRGQSISYALSTVTDITLGTGQVQSAPMLVRYPDTAYLAHGNYGVQYSLSFPLHNTTGKPQTVSLALQSPLKQDDRREGLYFLSPPPNEIFFRGTVQIRYQDDRGISRTRYVHIVQRRGEEGEPLVRLRMQPDERRLVEVDFLYPPDSTPPQVLTVQTSDNNL